jgi:hypothetical protein
MHILDLARPRLRLMRINSYTAGLHWRSGYHGAGNIKDRKPVEGCDH